MIRRLDPYLSAVLFKDVDPKYSIQYECGAQKKNTKLIRCLDPNLSAELLKIIDIKKSIQRNILWGL